MKKAKLNLMDCATISCLKSEEIAQRKKIWPNDEIIGKQIPILRTSTNIIYYLADNKKIKKNVKKNNFSSNETMLRNTFSPKKLNRV